MFFHFIFIFSILSSLFSSSLSSTLSPPQTLTDTAQQTLISSNRNFEFGFFSLSNNSANRYIGIWFNNVPQITPFWIANRDNPINDSSGVLTITTSGNIVLTANGSNTPFWSSNSSTNPASNPVLQLLDDGNLVVVVNDSSNYLWQSFEHPTDTLIPGMKLGWNLETNQEYFLTSWRNSQDPSSGDYTYKMDRRGLPQIVLRDNSQIEYRSGPWDGVRFGGGPELEQNSVFRPIMVFNSSEVYYAFENVDESIISRFVVGYDGPIIHYSWSERRNEWVNIATMQQDNCDNYDFCGPYGICNMNSNPICKCPSGFRPRLEIDWERFDWAGGCIRNVELNCSVTNVGFRRFTKKKLPDAKLFLVNETATNRETCRDACLGNCSCMAYAKTEASGCVNWFTDLVDIREYNEGGQDLYIRMDASQLGSSNHRRRNAAIASVSVITGVLLFGLIGWYVFRRKAAANRRRRRVLAAQRQYSQAQELNQRLEKDDLELPSFDYDTISTATDNFSSSNKIGEGGFGPVYKGQLATGQEIAVKRLSNDSGQGLTEFKNEIILYLKLQHRNLVRLLGCCIHGEGRMLIYEYMQNKSLDLFIFNQTRGTSLDWGKRFDIIVGIARGLLYLHRDSRLRIIHRDLKASNILLDGEMNPKISDFGLAKTFRGDGSQENTSRIIGTYGYMSPEYAIDGLFSVKSDVFSFGVLVLEIVSAKKNRGFYHPDHDLNLLGHAWKLWNEGKLMELVDVNMEGPISKPQILRCIQVGLLCVQQRPEDRPTMSSVLLMLDSENPILPQPKQPGFYTERFLDTDSSTTGKYASTSNEVTVTMLQGR